MATDITGLVKNGRHVGGLQALYPFEIMHYPSAMIVNLKAFVTDFSDSHDSEWAAETNAYNVGPTVVSQKSTTRTITVSLDMPAFSMDEAKRNMNNINKLAQFMYPTIRDNQIWTSTFLGVRFANWIHYRAVEHVDGFLPVYLENFTFKPDMEAMHFIEGSGVGFKIWPKLIKVEFAFKVAALHANKTSFNGTTKLFPANPWPYIASRASDFDSKVPALLEEVVEAVHTGLHDAGEAIGEGAVAIGEAAGGFFAAARKIKAGKIISELLSTKAAEKMKGKGSKK